MSLKIGTNIDYKAKRFLDERINLPSTLQDLKDWSTPVPEGFEVFVDGRWYVYRSTFEFDDTTGYWRKRIDNEYAGSELEQKDNSQDYDILMLMKEVFPLEFASGPSGTNSGTHEIGSTVKAENITISWSVKRKVDGNWVIQRLKLTGDDPKTKVTSDKTGGAIGDIQEFGTEGSYSYKYFHTEDITEPIKFTITAVTENGLSKTGSVSYSFSWKRYWGVTTDNSKSYFDGKKISSVSGEGNLVVGGSEFSGSWAKGSTSFNCTGGKYPYYIVPNDVTIGTVWIGGLRNTDFTIHEISLTNASGATRNYKVVTLNNIQTGTLLIEFK